MNGKLFLFGIGGTGARVIKSLVMVLAAGVNIDTNAIVPIIVDPDFENADVTRSVELMKSYATIRSYIEYNDATSNKFFLTNIDQITESYRLNLKNTKNKKFEDFILYNSLSEENKAFASILFSKKNLSSDMEMGFKGNPNMGSVVLNQFTDSRDFMSFATAFKPNDRIFIVSSIFGGTGASGFPLLLKNLRGLDSKIPNSEAIKKAPIGAVSVLPYFSVKPNEESAIDSSTFIGKMKAALQYYVKNVNGEQSAVNVMYHIGDIRTKQYENVEGGFRQQNNAHFVELASALSIIDFVAIPNDSPVLECEINSDSKVFVPKAEFKEFGIEDDVEQILFSNLARKTNDLLAKPLTQFVLLSRYMRDHMSSVLVQPWCRDNNIDSSFLNSVFIQELNKVVKAYFEWLNEMDDNDRSFKPFNVEVGDKELYDIVDGVKPSTINALWAFKKSGFDLFDAALNRTGVKRSLTTEQKFIELFYIVTKELVEKKIKF